MNNSKIFRTILLGLFVALIFAAALPIAAFADEGEPPPAPTDGAAEDPAAEPEDHGAEVTASPEGSEPLADPPVTGATEEPAAESEPAAPETAATEEPSAEPSSDIQVSELESQTVESVPALSDIPEGTEVVILDETGIPVPLASEEAAGILLDGDPMWCPAGVTPGGAGCTTNYATFALLLGDAVFGAAGPSVNGVIWVRDNYAGADAVAITINGLTLANTNMRNFALAIKGGWTGVGTAIDQTSPSFFDVPLSITNWNADVTLSDITIDAGNVTGLTVITTKNIVLTRVNSNNNTGGAAGRGAELNNSGGTGNVTITGPSSFSGNAGLGGLSVTSKGNITLNGITASGNTGTSYGAELVNTGGTGNISVTNSTFSGNSNLGGLRAFSKGTITLNNVTASSNTGTGALLTNQTAATAKNVTLTGTNVFSGNTMGGLTINSKGAISIMGATAQGNSGGVGAEISNAAGTMGVTISNSNFSSNTSSGGIFVTSNGMITLSSVTSDSNTSGFGAMLDNDSGTGAVSITNGSFNGNGSSGGLDVSSKGTITLNTVGASGNSGGGFGAILNNTASITGTSNISVTNGTFNSNTSFSGLQAYSNGTITLSSVVANGNVGYGAYLDNDAAPSAKAVTVNGSNNQFNSNSGPGLSILSKGNVSLSNITASSNPGGQGVYVDAVAGTGTVTFTTGTLNLNSQQGLYVSAKGTITLSGITANQNTFGGAILTNLVGTGNVAITSGTFNQNGSNGLSVDTAGTITLTNVKANSNTGGNGAQLDNCQYMVVPDPAPDVCSSGTSNKAVTLNGTNEFVSNRNAGLYIYATGAVTLNNIDANYNGIAGSNGSGVVIDNCMYDFTIGVNACLVDNKSVTFNGTNIFVGNYTNGLQVTSDGFVKLNSITANSNSHGRGAIISNNTASPGQPVTITGTNQFKFNAFGGLVVYSNGLISAANITANSNGPSLANGAYLDNTGVGNTAGISLTGVNVFNNNSWIGLNVHSYGPISVSSVTANRNGLIALTGGGAYLENLADLTAPYSGITLSGTNSFDGNYNEGLRIVSNGAISVNSVTSTNNVNSYGVYLDNTDGGFSNSNMPVTMTGTNVISGNFYSGLDISSYGAVTLNNVTATGNGTSIVLGYGVTINNSSADTPKTVTLNGTNNTSSNLDTGLVINTKGLIKVNSITSSDNGTDVSDYGASLNNNFAGTTAGVTLTGTNAFNGNYQYGIRITSRGPISINNLTASGNLNADGASIQNTGGGTSVVQNVTLTGTNVFNSNYSTGLVIGSYGAISVSNVTANGNGTSLSSGSGATLNNSGADPLLPLKGVTLTGVNQFNSNYDLGLRIDTRGAISASNLMANSNGLGTDQGAYLINNYGSGAGPGVTVSGTNQFTGNAGTGLRIVSNGAITINSVTAGGNGVLSSGWGADLNNDFSGVVGGITITGTNIMNGNDGGLTASSRGVISINNLTASNNLNLEGAVINNTGGGISVVKNVTLTGTNVFNNNYGTGLDITSYGAISVSNVTANENGTPSAASGAYLTNSGADPLLPLKGITITGVNQFSDNYNYGLQVYTRGTISAANVTANGNGTSGEDGAVLQNSYAPTSTPTNVSLSGTNQFNDNDGSGLLIYSHGAIAINNVTATGNGAGAGSGLYGVYLANYEVVVPTDTFVPHAITVTGTNNFSNNDGYGAYILAEGSVSASNVTANGNLAGYGMFVDGTSFGLNTSPQGFTLTGTNQFNANVFTGLFVQVYGPISLNAVTASDNGTGGGFGAYLDNCLYVVSACTTSTNQKVALTGVMKFNSNNSGGLYVTTRGVITSSTSLAADNNTNGVGANLVNSYGNGTAVTLSGNNNFSSNFYSGLSVTSEGTITVNSITAVGNGISGGAGYGAGLTNYSDPLNIFDVKITGTNIFSDNYDGGLYVNTLGAISLTSSVASGNTNGNGLDLHNDGGEGKAVTLTGTFTLNNNGVRGLYLVSHGAITLNNITANNNGVLGSSAGAFIQNSAASAAQFVKLNGTNTFNDNNGGGLSITSKGAITTNNVSALDNSTIGASISNQVVGATAGVTMNGINNFLSNGGSGLIVNSHGAISLFKVTSDGNNGDGIFASTDGGNFTLSCGWIANNTNNGVNISTNAILTLKGVIVSGNSAGDYVLSYGSYVPVRTC